MSVVLQFRSRVDIAHQMAALSWQEYLARGRGLVLVDMDGALKPGETHPGSLLPTTVCWYAALGSPQYDELELCDGDQPVEAVKALIATYDPSREFVLCALIDGVVKAAIFVYEGPPFLTPPDAYVLMAEKALKTKG